MSRRAGGWSRLEGLIQKGFAVLVPTDKRQGLHLGHEFFHIQLGEAALSQLGLLLDTV
jgi:hypothetical protein